MASNKRPPKRRDLTDDELVMEFLLRDVPLDSTQQRRAAEVIGRLLTKVPPDDAGPFSDWVCFMLGHMLLNGTLVTTPRPRQDSDIWLHVGARRSELGKWEAAVSSAMEEYGVSRATVTRAWKESREFREAADKFRERVLGSNRKLRER
jgi:hypothetical protein